MADVHYGGQAVIEGVMMRGATSWAVAVRRPDDSIWVESHPLSDLAARRPWTSRPLVRGVFALADSLSVGMRALDIAAREAFADDDADPDVGRATTTLSMVIALVVFVAVFIVRPSAAVASVDRLLGGGLGDGAAFHVVESLVRIAVFLGYLWSISLVADIRRVFEYHGAEHATITAWERGEDLDPATIVRHSTVHVRCGTNFLVMVMLLALVVYTAAGALVPAPDGGLVVTVAYHVVLRVVLLPVVAGLAYEGLRLGAARGDHLLVRALVAPGLWLQRITTKPPTTDQVEVAIRAFAAVVPPDDLATRTVATLPSPVVTPEVVS